MPYGKPARGSPADTRSAANTASCDKTLISWRLTSAAATWARRRRRRACGVRRMPYGLPFRTLGRHKRARPEPLPEDLENEIDWRSRREPQVSEPGLLGQAAQPLFSCLRAEAQADLLG